MDTKNGLIYNAGIVINRLPELPDDDINNTRVPLGGIKTEALPHPPSFETEHKRGKAVRTLFKNRQTLQSDIWQDPPLKSNLP